MDATTAAELIPAPTPSDEALVEDAVAYLHQLRSRGLLRVVVDIGDYLVRTFYGDHAAAVSRKPNKAAALARLYERDDLPVAPHALKQAVRIAVQYRDFPRELAEGLSKSHHEELLAVADRETKLALAQEALAAGLTSRELRDRVADLGPRNRTGMGGRPPLPPVVKRVGGVLRMLDAPGLDQDLEPGDLAGLGDAEREKVRDQVAKARALLDRIARALGEVKEPGEAKEPEARGEPEAEAADEGPEEAPVSSGEAGGAGEAAGAGEEGIRSRLVTIPAAASAEAGLAVSAPVSVEIVAAVPDSPASAVVARAPLPKPPPVPAVVVRRTQILHSEAPPPVTLRAEGPAAPRAPTAAVLAAMAGVDGILAEIEAQVGRLARLAPERMRLTMLGWICRARAHEEQHPDSVEITRRVGRVAKRLSDLARMFWPGSVRALQAATRPSDVFGNHVDSWERVARRAEEQLADHLRRAKGCDEDGWADGAGREAALGEAEAEAAFREALRGLEKVLGRDGEEGAGGVGVGGMGGGAGVNEKQVAALVGVAGRLRAVRGRVADDVAWGAAMGRLRRVAGAAAGGGGGGGGDLGRLREVLEAGWRPAAAVGVAGATGKSAAPVVVAKAAEREGQGDGRLTELLAGLPTGSSSLEELEAWVLRAIDAFNTAELAALLWPMRERVAQLEVRAGELKDRRQRRRVRDLLEKVGAMGEEEARRVGERLRRAA